MTRNAFFYIFIVNLLRIRQGLQLPSFLRDILKKQDVENVEKLEDFFDQELENTSLQSEQAVAYFLFVVKAAITHYLLRQDGKLKQTLEITRHRMQALRNVMQDKFDGDSWDNYLSVVEAGINRMQRHQPIESFEEVLSDLDWESIDGEFIHLISAAIGYVYMAEQAEEQRSKGRIWLSKSIHEGSTLDNVVSYLYLTDYHAQSGSENDLAQIEAFQNSLREGAEASGDAEIQQILGYVIRETAHAAQMTRFGQEEDPSARLENSLSIAREQEVALNNLDTKAPRLYRAQHHAHVAHLYGRLYDMTADDIEQSSFTKASIQHIDQSVSIGEALQDEAVVLAYKIDRANLAVVVDFPLTEKVLKEITSNAKKTQHYVKYIEAVKSYIGLLARNDISHKSYDLLLDIFRYGQKNQDTGGFYLTLQAFLLGNEVFQREADSPGVSWIVHQLDGFFERITQTIKILPEKIEQYGKTDIESFRLCYNAFEPVSHFNIKVYYLYQLNEIFLLRLGSILNEDETTLKIANTLLDEISDPNNPLHFMYANWEEFKDVPNSVRNKTLNKCINISKGDLPLAAEHLDFSYRNLRSYITFKEVNRLGFFLDIKQTSNRQLEQGIRYMFYDLYRKGTIFEVVFDMPSFLVKYAQSGFFSQDLERELQIKGTTAKKYLKIMTEIGLIRQDKTTGRKHYYRLRRENVMNRLGADQKTMISAVE